MALRPKVDDDIVRHVDTYGPVFKEDEGYKHGYQQAAQHEVVQHDQASVVDTDHLGELKLHCSGFPKGGKSDLRITENTFGPIEHRRQ